jgi:hypothetical protein
MKSIKLALGTLLISLTLNSYADTVIINTPNGGQTVCITQNGVITCF